MTTFEDTHDGVEVHGAGLPPIFSDEFERIAAENPDNTVDEVFRQTCVAVGNLAAQAADKG